MSSLLYIYYDILKIDYKVFVFAFAPIQIEFVILRWIVYPNNILFLTRMLFFTFSVGLKKKT